MGRVSHHGAYAGFGVREGLWSRREDRELLEKHLVHAPRKKVLVLQGATHFVHLDRKGHGRRELIDEVVAWVKEVVRKVGIGQ